MIRMPQNKNRIVRILFLLLCCAVLITCSIIVLSQKGGFYLDEYSSYGCANSATGKRIPQTKGVTYSSEEILQRALDTYSVSADERFRFDYVYKNLSQNVHPPVFYVLLHIVCSLTPGGYNVWQAGAVNILFGVILLIFFQKFMRAFTRSEWIAGLLTLAWTCVQGLYVNVTLLRDYAAAMCATMILAWEVFRFLRGNRGIPDLVKIAAASALSVLCHYYCAIYLFFLCAVLCVILMARKEWKDLIHILIAEACAGVAALAAFPPMISRILNSSRGVQATENLTDADVSSFMDRLSYFFRQTNNAFFGGVFLYLLILAAMLGIGYLLTRGKRKLHKEKEGLFAQLTIPEILLLLLPAVFYFILVSKIAAMKTARYMYPVTALLYLSLIAVLIFFGKKLLNHRVLAAGLAVIMLAVGCLSWPAGEFRHLYRGLPNLIREKLEPYRGTDAIQIWTNISDLYSVTVPQYEYYGSVTFYYKPDEEELKGITALNEKRDVILLCGKESRDMPETLQQYFPGYTVTEIGCLDGQSRFYNYYLHFE